MGEGVATPLCPSTNRGAKGKFSVLKNGQEWGWGPTESLWSSKNFLRVGTGGPLLEAKTRLDLLS